MAIRVWDFLPDRAENAAKAAERLSISPLAARVVAARGEEEEALLAARKCNSEHLHDPYQMQDMEKAVAAVREAIENDKMICVFGDYDCDGISATAIVTDYLTQVGARVCYRIPDREKEGYGLNKTAIRELFDYGVRLLLTVDNGVSAAEEISYANSLGMQVVVTDHHTPPSILPDAAAILNPHRTDCHYPFPELCGAGVAFKLLCALEGENGYGLLEEYGDLLAIGTVADVVPLCDENRAFVSRGLELLENTERCGLRALLRCAGLEGKSLSAEHISFSLAPRMNAAGRICSAETVVELLLTESETEAATLAEQLNTYNYQRREQEKVVMDDISAQLSQNPALLNERILVLDGTGWNAGIVGIVCSRFVDRFGKPCLVIARDGALAKGSGRSVEGFSLIDAITACSAYLTRYGGHPLAAGFSLMAEDIPAFRAALNAYAAEKAQQMPPQRLKIDCVVPSFLLTTEEIRGLSVLEPFGCGNEAPLFAVCGARLERVTPLSEGKYARLRLILNNEELTVVSFRQGAAALGFFAGKTVDVAFSAGINEYQGTEKPSLRLIDIRFSREDLEALHKATQDYEAYLRGEITGAELLPSREECAAVYRYFRSFGSISYEPELLYRRFSESAPMGYIHFRIAVDIFLELNLFRIKNGKIEVVSGAAKVDLQSAAIVRRLTDHG